MAGKRENKKKYAGSQRYLYIHFATLILYTLFPIGVYLWLHQSRLIPHSSVWVPICAIALSLVGLANVIVYYFKIFKPQMGVQELIRMLESTFGSVGEKGSDQSQILMQLLNRQANYELLRKEAEIEVLQSQINPHFLYNTLETIRGQAIFVGAKDIADTTKALADIFRYSISKKGTLIHLRDEISNIESYMRIQQIRFNNKFELQLEIDAEVEDLQLPKLIVQPVVENALKHGLEEKVGRGKVLIRSFRTPKELIVEVMDDGVGMTIERLKAVNARIMGKCVADDREGTGTHIGLSNINYRIKMIYGDAYGLVISSAEGIGTTVTLHLGIMQ